MYAIRVHQFGGPEALVYDEVEVPNPGPAEVRLKVEAIGVNFIDTKFRAGAYPIPTPFIPGGEAAGVVEAVGEAVTLWKVGDRVGYLPGNSLGTYAEYLVVPEKDLLPLPTDIPMQQAAALLLQGLTARAMAHGAYAIQPGDSVLIHAAAGGVGGLLVQMAKQAGAAVYGTVSSEVKAEIARAAGADAAIIYTQTNFVTEVKRLTNGKGVNVVYDAVGKDTFEGGLNVLRPRGYMVLYGSSSGEVPPIKSTELYARGGLYLTHTSAAYFMTSIPDLLAHLTNLFDGVRSGTLKLHIDSEFRLAEAAVAHRKLENRESVGKLLLIPG